jgi:hypothetical protein
MMYKTKVAVCSEIRRRALTQSEHHVEFYNINPYLTNVVYIWSSL